MQSVPMTTKVMGMTLICTRERGTQFNVMWYVWQWFKLYKW